jgi:hypothetical protein
MQSRSFASVLALLALALGGASNEGMERSPGFEVFVEPGLVAELPVSRVVPTLPTQLGDSRFGGTIRSIERVALVRGQNTPSIHPDLSLQPSDVPVWVVLCRGEFSAHGPYDYSARATRAFYYVHHASGVRYGWGSLAEEAR